MNRNLLFVLIMFFSSITVKAQVFSLPFTDDFETGAPGWITENDPGNSWELGMPNYGATNSVHAGTACWDINLNVGYTNNANCRLRSPKLDVSGIASLSISFWQNRLCENGWDGMVLEYATDSISGWNILGSYNAPLTNNWYSDSTLLSSGEPGWSGNSLGWVPSSIVIPNPSSTGSLWIRFRFTSDASVTVDGISIDDFQVEASEMNVTSGTVYLDVNSNNIIDAGDTPQPNIILSAIPNLGGYYQTSDSSGNYAFIVDAGVATTVSLIAPLYSIVTPPDYTITLVGTNQSSTGHDFLITYLPGVIDAGINLNGTGVRPGMNNTKFIHYFNQGTAPVSGTIEFTYDPILALQNASNSYTVLSPNVIEFSYSNLLPGETRYMYVNFVVDSQAVVGTNTMASVIIYPIVGDSLPINNYDSLVNPVVNSCDPNNKLVDPEGDIAIQDVASGIDLDYTVNFQNTGTAEAIHINIFDVLDNNLDLSTLSITGSSHPLTHWSIDANNQVQFTFANINLPDSTSNEPASHGFVSYRIRPFTNLSAGTVINNIAAIIFDNNLPVITNAVSSMVVDPLGLSSPANQESVSVFPNPNNGYFYMMAPKGYDTYQVINSIGQKIAGGIITSNENVQQIELDKVPSGIYLLMISGNNSTQSTTILIE